MKIVVLIIIFAVAYYCFTRKKANKNITNNLADTKQKRRESITIKANPLNVSQDKARAFITEQVSYLKNISEVAREELIKQCMKENLLNHNYVYYDNVFNKYFDNIDWTWEEYEYWRKHGNKTGNYPSSMSFTASYVCDVSDVTAENLAEQISIPKAKKILATCGIEPPKKQVGAGIRKLAQENDVFADALLKDYYTGRQRSIFMMFLSTLSLRLKAYDFAEQFPTMKYETMYLREKPENVKLGQKLGFTKYPPFLPGGMDTRKPILR